MKPIIRDDSLVLFIGDSITDCDRKRDEGNDLGRGYVFMAAGWFSLLYPEKNVRFLNRGIGGNAVEDLKSRWQADCLDLKPDWISILAGVNDTWRRYFKIKPPSTKSPEDFERDYREILVRTKKHLPNARLIICEQYLLHMPEDRLGWREDFNPKKAIVRKLAKEFADVFIPLDEIFAGAAARKNADFWAPDGVHPSPAGHALIARSWLEAVKAL